MAKTREVTVDGELAELIDEASVLDARVKTLEVKAKDWRERILELAEKLFGDDETSVELVGVEGRATLTKVFKAKPDGSSLDAAFGGNERFRDAVKSGSLGDLIERRPSLVVAPGDVDKALEALKVAGVACGSKVDWKVDAKALRARKASTDGSDERIVRTATESTTDYRVKYERG